LRTGERRDVRECRESCSALLSAQCTCTESCACGIVWHRVVWHARLHTAGTEDAQHSPVCGHKEQHL